MQLVNITIPGKEGSKNIHIENGKIKAVKPVQQIDTETISLIFDNAITFPGLINSHDHLDFNLFPPLRNRIYTNYAEWGNDIQANNKKTINEILKIPQHLRVQWGLYKNLLNGVTTVVNHGEKLRIGNELLTVFENWYSLHSIRFEKNWKFKLNRPGTRNWPYVIHVGEGTDDDSHHEIDQLIKWNLFKKDIIGVHGVAMDEKQAASFQALVWCPVSNYFLLDKTAHIASLKEKTNIIFGTDSTLTSSWNIWEHLRLARNEKSVSDADLFNMITKIPAKVWGLQNKGEISEQKDADIVVAKNKNPGSFDAFYSLNPQDILLILHKGNIRIFDESLYDQLSRFSLDTGIYSKIYYNDICKYVQGNLAALIEGIKEYYPAADIPFGIHLKAHTN
jgi:cytosine/adenosine deaminase-related metal-dependent hydrolase